MIKPTPNPPEIDPTSPYESLDSKKLHDAADRALDHYLCPPGSTPPPRKTRRMYAVTADFKNEELLADASETLASARTIAHDFAHLIPASQRRTSPRSAACTRPPRPGCTGWRCASCGTRTGPKTCCRTATCTSGAAPRAPGRHVVRNPR